MSYRLLATDLDGTAIADGQSSSRRVREAVAAATAHGVMVVLATGRPFVSAKIFASELGLQTPAICLQGAVVRELAGEQRTLLVQRMPEAPLMEALELAQRRRLDLTVYSEELVFTAKMHHSEEFYARWFGIPKEDVGSYAAIPDRMRALGMSPVKALFIGEPDENDRLVPELVERFAGRLAVVRSHPFFVELTAPEVSKSTALAHLARHLGVARDEIVAVGDSGNDVSMIRWAGTGVAMGNATPDVLAAADWVAPSIEEDGLAVVIERFFLNGDATNRKQRLASLDRTARPA